MLLSGLIKPGWTVLDIGANIGTMTVAFARFVGQEGHVYAFEPQLYPHGCLGATVALNSMLHYVTPFKAAVGETIGEIPVPLLDPTKQTNFGGTSLQDKHTAPTEMVPMLNVDSISLPDCHLIKADVEGMEGAVLRGAVKTIEKCRPLIWVEQLDHKECAAAELKEFFKAHDYKAWKLATHLYSPHNARGERFNPFQYPDGTLMEDHNVIGVPHEDDPPEWVAKAEVFE